MYLLMVVRGQLYHRSHTCVPVNLKKQCVWEREETGQRNILSVEVFLEAHPKVVYFSSIGQKSLI